MLTPEPLTSVMFINQVVFALSVTLVVLNIIVKLRVLGRRAHIPNVSLMVTFGPVAVVAVALTGITNANKTDSIRIAVISNILLVRIFLHPSQS